MESDSIVERIARIDWEKAATMLADRGHAVVGPLLDPVQCRELAALYDRRELFRSRVDMARMRFGVGEYKYFAAPVPAEVATLRNELYACVVPIANDWSNSLGLSDFPATFRESIRLCHQAGQTKPTPLLLQYAAGGYNCLHQDLYGEWVFPLQFTVMLTDPARDFSGGEFLLVEQRPRAQSRGQAIVLQQGEAVLFPNSHRPVRSARGWSRVNVRHGVSTVERGRRVTLGIIFHDAK
jgi:hypothetical protein